MDVQMDNFFSGLIEVVTTYLQTFLQDLLTGFVESILPF